MSSLSFVQSVSHQCQKLYSAQIAPALEEIRVSCLPYVHELDEVVEAVRSDYCAFQDTCAGFVESLAGPTVASVSRVASTVFPEIVAFVTAVTGHSLIPISILAGRVISEFSWALASYCNMELTSAKMKVKIGCEEIRTRLVQGAVMTSFIAGGAFLVQGMLSRSFPTCMRGALFLTTALAAKDVLLPHHTVQVGSSEASRLLVV